jgi:hypothetical protein
VVAGARRFIRRYIEIPVKKDGNAPIFKSDGYCTPSGRHIVDSISIGLDIGSSAVRAAEVEVGGGRRVLRRYAQVGLPHGYVVDGEIINIPGVSAASPVLECSCDKRTCRH